MPEETAPFPPLDAARVREALAGSRFADVRYQARTGSTNDDATPLLGRADAAGVTLVAEEQTAGRGRKPPRRWIAPPGTGLLFTAILPPPLTAGALWAVPFWAALCAAEGIARSCGVHVDLRWPNDLFVDGRKTGGILCISRVTGAAASAACGIGINVLRPAPDAVAAIAPPPAFLSDAAPHVAREPVLSAILLAFDCRLDMLAAPAEVVRAYEARAGLAGSRYRVRGDADESELEGVALGLGPDGALRLEVDGIEHAISLADARRV